MKKIEASSIKRLLRINWYLLSVHFLELSHYSLSLSLTLGHFEFSWSTWALEKERKIKQGRVGSSNYSRIIYRYLFSYVISLLDLAWMTFHVVSCCIWMVFLGERVVFRLASSFLYIFDEMGFSYFSWAGLPDGFEAEWGGYLKWKTHGLIVLEPGFGSC